MASYKKSDRKPNKSKVEKCRYIAKARREKKRKVKSE